MTHTSRLRRFLDTGDLALQDSGDAWRRLPAIREQERARLILALLHLPDRERDELRLHLKDRPPTHQTCTADAAA